MLSLKLSGKFDSFVVFADCDTFAQSFQLSFLSGFAVCWRSFYAHMLTVAAQMSLTRIIGRIASIVESIVNAFLLFVCLFCTSGIVVGVILGATLDHRLFIISGAFVFALIGELVLGFQC